MDKYDIALWIKKVIDSCKTIPQLIACYKLIERHRIIFDNYDLMYDLNSYYDLKSKLIEQKIFKR